MEISKFKIGDFAYFTSDYHSTATSLRQYDAVQILNTGIDSDFGSNIFCTIDEGKFDQPWLEKCGPVFHYIMSKKS